MIGISCRHLKPGFLSKQRKKLSFRQVGPRPVALRGVPKPAFGLGGRPVIFGGAAKNLVNFLIGDRDLLGPNDGVEEEVPLDAPLRGGAVFRTEAIFVFRGPFPALTL